MDGPILLQLWKYVYHAHPKNKLIFIGDSYQLPPINETLSKALQPDQLSRLFHVKVEEFELTQVERQGSDSATLNLAKSIRNKIKTNGYKISHAKQLKMAGLTRIWKNGDVVNQYLSDFDVNDPSRAVMLAYSNKWTQDLNQLIRRELYHKVGYIGS